MPQNTENLRKYSNQESEWDSVMFGRTITIPCKKKRSENIYWHACNKASVISGYASFDDPWMDSIDSHICFSCLKIPCMNKTS